MRNMDVIDVIVPVHKGLAATRRCLESVLSASSTIPCETVVVDDATPEPEITRLLDELAAATPSAWWSKPNASISRH